MLEKSLLVFPCASEKRPVDSHMHAGSQTAASCYKSSIQSKPRCVLRLKLRPSEEVLKLREENCREKHLAKTGSVGELP